MVDRNSTWTGGLTLTADSKIFRNSADPDAQLTLNGPLALGGNTLTFRDRFAFASTFTNNASSGDGSIDVHAYTVNIGASSVFGGAGNIIVRTDGVASPWTTPLR